MPAKRVILELGTGNDLHGGDYTKAALRAVQAALHHSSLTMLRTLGVNSKTGMFVDVTIGVQQPDKADGAFAAASPRHDVPALIDGDVRIFDWTRILEYLEDKSATPPLLPCDHA